MSSRITFVQNPNFNDRVSSVKKLLTPASERRSKRTRRRSAREEMPRSRAVTGTATRPGLGAEDGEIHLIHTKGLSVNF